MSSKFTQSKQTYSPEVFSSLSNFERARDILPQYKPFLNDIGALICMHGLENSLAVSLLHKHFELNGNERLVKDFLDDGAVILPTPMTDGLELIPYMWKLSVNQSDQSVSYHPLEFLRATDQTNCFREVSDSFERAQPFILALAQQLHELGADDVFGISLIHADPVDEGEIWLEETNSRKRTIRLSVGSENHGIAGVTETNWIFTIDRSLLCDDCRQTFGLGVVDEEPSKKPCEKPDKPWKDKSWKINKPIKPTTKPDRPLVDPQPGVICTVHCHRHCHGHCHVHCTSHCHKHCPPHIPERDA